ncbi:T9SS type A sorting domain-containing protein, partial [Bacteroidota bacterium]
IHLTKLNASGNWLWTKTYMESGYSSGLRSKISKDMDGNYLLCGKYSSSNSGFGFFINVDSIGDTLFTRKLINPIVGISDVFQTSDSSYFITGIYNVFDTLSNSYLKHVCLAKISKSGNLLYSRTFLDTMAYSVYPIKSIEISPGNYVTLALNSSFSIYSESSLLIKTSDSSGNGWQKLVYNNMPWGNLLLWDIELVSGGGFMVCGSATYYYSYMNSDSASSAIIEFDTAGNIVWHKSYGPAHNYYGSSFFDIEETNNLNYIAGGYIYYSGLSNPGNIFFLKLNKEIDSMCNEVAINPATVNKQLIQGSIGNLSSGMSTSNLTSISTYNYAINDTNLCAITTFLQNPIGEKNITVYPNPASESITIDYQTKSKNPLFEIYNSYGALIRKERLTSTYHHVIRADDLVNGLYLIKLIDRNYLYQSKFIKD